MDEMNLGNNYSERTALVDLRNNSGNISAVQIFYLPRRLDLKSPVSV